MKRIWLYIMIVTFLSACNGIKTSELTECENIKAKAILWIDRTGNEKLTKYGAISTAKVRAKVFSDGTLRIISYCKKQKPEVITYLEKRVAAFTIPKRIFDGGYIKPGEQYLQLRYIPAKVWSPHFKPSTNKKSFQF